MITHNKYNKRYHHYSLIILLILITLFYACESNEDFDDPREGIAGEWICNEESELYDSPPYPVYISLDELDSSKVIISNFYNLGDLAYAYAKMNDNVLTLTPQPISDGTTDWIIKSGTGYISSNYKEIDWQYVIDDGSGQLDHVTATYTASKY